MYSAIYRRTEIIKTVNTLTGVLEYQFGYELNSQKLDFPGQIKIVFEKTENFKGLTYIL